MSRFLACLEMRPVRGTWEYEERRATFEGEVELIFRHPNPLAYMRPRRFRIPMIYAQHVPPAFTYRHGTPPPQPARRRSHFRFRPAAPARTPPERAAPEDPSRPGPSRTVRFAPSPERVSSVVQVDSEEEDPEEGESEPAGGDAVQTGGESDQVVPSTGSQWMVDEM